MKTPPPIMKSQKIPSFWRRFSLKKLRFSKIAQSLFYRIQRIKNKKDSQICSFGDENPDKTFYVIRRYFYSESAGHAAIINHVLIHCAYADMNGYIPVAEEKDENAGGNDVFFIQYCLQPSGYSPKDIQKSKNIILSANYPLQDFSVDFFYDDPANSERFKYFQDIYKKYIKFNGRTLEYMEKDFNRVIGGKKRVLGCLVRGTDYTLKKPSCHYVQPSAEEVIEKVDRFMKEKDCRFIYLATESEEVYDLFKRHFGGSLLVNSQKRFNENDLKGVIYLAQVKERRKNDRYLTGLEYFSSLNILSKCDCLIGGRNGGTMAAYMMGGGFEYSYIWNLGVYP